MKREIRPLLQALKSIQPRNKDESDASAVYVERNRTLGATGQAGEAAARNTHAGNGGQGSEQTELLPILQKFFELAPVEGAADATKSLKDYNPETGGLEETREAAAGWLRRNLGLSFATKDNTFLARQGGRTLVHDVADFIAQQYNHKDNKKDFIQYALDHNKSLSPAVLIPKNSWGLIHEAFELAGFEVIEYDVDPDDLVKSYEDALTEASKTHVVGIGYFNSPHNATGLHLSVEHNRGIKRVTDAHNGNAQYKTAICHDVPYYSSSPKNENEREGYLNTGLHGVYDEDADQEDPITPFFVVFSGSKFFRLAQTGFAMMSMDSKSAKGMRRYQNIVGHGITFARQVHANLAVGFKKAMDVLWRKQLDTDRTKVVSNCAALHEKFGEAVVPGGDNLIQLIEQQRDDFLGRVVEGCDGKMRIIQNPADLLESFDNGYEGDGYGYNDNSVILADGEEKDDPKKLYFRFSLAANSAEFQEKILDRAARNIAHMKTLPFYHDLSAEDQKMVCNL